MTKDEELDGSELTMTAAGALNQAIRELFSEDQRRSAPNLDDFIRRLLPCKKRNPATYLTACCLEGNSNGVARFMNKRAGRTKTHVRQKDGIALIAAERQRQLSVEGWTPEHDDSHSSGEMAQAAAVYAMQHGLRQIHSVSRWLWPWDLQWFKPGDRIRDLEKAGALIAAEIDRLLRCLAEAQRLLSGEHKGP